MSAVNDQLLGRLKREGVARDVSDPACPGLQFRVQKSGRIYCRGRFKRRGDTTSRRFDLGEYGKPHGLSIAEARKKWVLMRDQLRAGEEPTDARPEELAIDDAIAVFMERHVRRNLKPSTVAEYERILERDVLSRWRGRPLHGIRKSDVQVMLDDVADKSLGGGGTGANSNRYLAYVKSFFGWCVGRGYLEASPADRIPKPVLERPRDRVLSLEEIRAIWAAVSAFPEPIPRAFAQTLILTGQRRGEVSIMRWENIDFDTARWTIPASDTKNNRPHVVPIARPLRDLLRASPRLQTCPYVFHNAKGKPLNAFSRIKLAVAAAAPEVGDWRFHDFRRSMSTHLQSVDVSLEVISRILNHTPQGVTQTHYALYAYEDEKRAALDNWATTVTQTTV